MVDTTQTLALAAAASNEPLLTPFQSGNISLPNRFAMAPMTREFSPGGIPGTDVPEYYRLRAAGGVGLIITEGTWIPHPAAGRSSAVPELAEGAPAQAWGEVIDAVHAEGSKIYCQLWHQGIARGGTHLARYPNVTRNPDIASVSPSGVGLGGAPSGEALDAAGIAELVEAYVQGARIAQQIGFDGIELHGGHGYLFDQFMWEHTNRRQDEFGDPLRFPTLVVRSIREAVGPGFPICFRFSQWKLDLYDVKLFPTVAGLERALNALSEAGVDIFHPSTRRFWEPAFPDEDPELTLAGWTRRITGKPTIIVGSVGLDSTFADSAKQSGRFSAEVANLDRLLELFAQGQFDVAAVGRALLSEPDWVRKHSEGRLSDITPYEFRFRETLLSR